MSRKALLIGINYIGSSAQLNGCVNDVLNIKNLLVTQFNVNESNIIMLTEAAGSKNLMPTKANILNYIQWLVSDATSESRLFFHYSGHGSHMTDQKNSLDENDGQDEMICPLDYVSSGFILDDHLRKVLVEPLPKGCNLFALMDCCHSATILDLKYVYGFNNTPKNQQYTIQIESRQKEAVADVSVFSGSEDHDFSSDAHIAGKYQGAMSYCFIKSYQDLKATGKEISAFNMMRCITDNLKYRGFKQNARLSTGKFVDLTTPLTII